jgi:hypothetical protein
MPMMKDSKRLHRSVVLPDYQGIGVGMSFKKAVCDVLRKEGWGGLIWSVTTKPAQYHAQIRSPYWKLVRYGQAKLNSGGRKRSAELKALMGKTSSRQRITYSFVYVGEEGKERL